MKRITKTSPVSIGRGFYNTHNQLYMTFRLIVITDFMIITNGCIIQITDFMPVALKGKIATFFKM